MRKARTPSVRAAAVVLAACIGATVVGAGSPSTRRARVPAAEAADTVLTATLSGAEEVPGPGAQDGSGSFRVTGTPTQNQACYDLTTTGLSDVTAAHIHEGDAGKSGPPVLALHVSPDGTGKGCATVKADVITAMMSNPSHYYVNVHDKAHPAGAIRGQLGT